MEYFEVLKRKVYPTRICMSLFPLVFCGNMRDTCSKSNGAFPTQLKWDQIFGHAPVINLTINFCALYKLSRTDSNLEDHNRSHNGNSVLM